MGLDISLFKVSFPENLDSNKIYSEEEFQELSLGNYKLFEKKELRKYESFHPYVTKSKKIKAERIFWDTDKILELTSTPKKRIKNFYLKHEDELYLTFQINKEEISILKTDIKNYEKKEIIEYFICKKDEVAYQRGICEEGGEILDRIGNCNHFYGPSLVRMMAVFDILNEDFLDNVDEDCVFFAWW